MPGSVRRSWISSVRGLVDELVERATGIDAESVAEGADVAVVTRRWAIRNPSAVRIRRGTRRRTALLVDCGVPMTWLLLAQAANVGDELVGHGLGRRGRRACHVDHER